MHSGFKVLLLVAAMAGAYVPAFGKDRKERIHLSSFHILRGATEHEGASHLDAGVEEVEAAPMNRCEFIEPIKPKPAEKAWFPFDFYTEMREMDRIKHAKSMGTEDFFFEGDDENRNGRGDSFEQTRELAKSLQGSLTFTPVKKQKDKSTFQLLVKFVRGALTFEGLMEARTWKDKDGCNAGLFYCTKKKIVDKEITCAADGWTHRILRINAIADTEGYLKDQARSIFSTLKETERNDVAALKAAVVAHDAEEDLEAAIPLDLASK
jgi:hypothetical protein